MAKVLSVFVLSSFLFLGGCQKTGVNGVLGGSFNGNTPSGENPPPGGGVVAGCPSATPSCPSGDGTCAYLVWQESSLTDPTVPTPIFYNVYYGNSSGVYTSQVSAIDGLCYQLTGLSAGDYYFVVTAYNINGMSPYSNEGTKSIALALSELQKDQTQKVSSEIKFVVRGQSL